MKKIKSRRHLKIHLSSNKRFFLISVILIIIGAIFYVWYLSNYTLTVDYYTVKSDKLGEPIRIVQLTDLHDYIFGEKNKNLVNLVRNQQADIIVLTGDMLNNDTDDHVICELVEELCKLAPVYYSLGNHEYNYVYENKNVQELTADLEQAGAFVIEQQYADILINGNSVRIGGLFGYVLSEPTSWMDGSEQEFMHQFEDTDKFKILLSHQSEGLLLWNSMGTYDVDLIFSGHIHGGEIILPFTGGLYSPEEGFFPQYTSGIFEKGGSTLVLSRGLGTSGIPGYGFKTRWNNIPQIVVVDIKAQD